LACGSIDLHVCPNHIKIVRLLKRLLNRLMGRISIDSSFLCTNENYGVPCQYGFLIYIN
jgi:hypothetical protein